MNWDLGMCTIKNTSSFMRVNLSCIHDKEDTHFMQPCLSHVMCNVTDFTFKKKWKRGGASWFRVCYHWGLPRLVCYLLLKITLNSLECSWQPPSSNKKPFLSFLLVSSLQEKQLQWTHTCIASRWTTVTPLHMLLYWTCNLQFCSCENQTP